LEIGEAENPAGATGLLEIGVAKNPAAIVPYSLQALILQQWFFIAYRQ